MTCDICGMEGARILHPSRVYGKGDGLLVVENVPVVSCPNCCTSHLTADTLREIERIKSQRGTRSVKRPVLVADFG